MTTSARSARLVSGLAAAAVSIAAVATAVSTWDGRFDAPSPAPVQAQRPAADGPVNVVKAPPHGEGQRQPVSCRDCVQRPMEQRL